MAGWFEKIRAVFSSTLPSNHAGESGNKKCAEVHDTNPANNLKVSAMDGVELIKKYEGFVSKAYKCPAGVCTIGFGSTTWADGTPIKMGQTITQEKAEALLVDYLNKNVRPKLAPLKLKRCQQTALESLIYNIGWGAFSRSKCYTALKNKDWQSFIREYDWVKGGGKVLPGLLKRRTEELYIFFSQGV